MGWISIVLGLLIAVAIMAGAFRIPNQTARGAASIAALVVIILGLLLSSIRFVPDDRLGVVIKNAMGGKLPPGRIVATGGEMGPQARILPPGWHLGYWPIIYEIELYPVLNIEPGSVGIITATDGKALPDAQVFAPEWTSEQFEQMLDAEYFLTDGGGFKGAQTSVLRTGSYRVNPKLFSVEVRQVTNIPQAAVGVVKSNVGQEAPGVASPGKPVLVDRTQRGIWKEHLNPGTYPLNTAAYEVTTISTQQTIAEFTKGMTTGNEREIQVRTSDGFNFPVDVRVEYQIEPQNAPTVVALLKNDEDGLMSVLSSAVRAIFRNNAERVKALDYVNQRSQQEKQVLEALSTTMRNYGVTVSAVRIGDLGGTDEQWKSLLKTQTDREIALQEQITFKEQQKAAEQKKELSRSQQEADEEKRLATATYQVKIATEEKQQAIIKAGAEAEALRIQAEAQAEAFRVIAQQIGPSNAAMLEMLKVVGKEGINITPRVMVNSGFGGGTGPVGLGAEATALFGTMLDRIVRDEELEATPGASGGAATPAPARGTP